MNSPFNEKRYKELLEGLEISEISFSELNDEKRIDAEYFSKNFVALNSQLLRFGTRRIMDVADVTDGIHTSIDYDENSRINLISATSPRENYFDLSRQVFISEKAHRENPRTALKENDVIVSTVGTIGNCAVVNKNILPANSDRHVGIIRIKDKYSPYVLSTFIISKYGRMQTLRESTGNVQLNLFIYKLKELSIPEFSNNFQNQIDCIVKNALDKLERAKERYIKAEALLLQELGLIDWKQNTENVSVKSFKDSFCINDRLDAEYYRPQYDDFESIIKRNNWNKLSDLCLLINHGMQPPYVDNGEMRVFSQKWIKDKEIDYSFIDDSNEPRTSLQFAKENPDYVCRKFDIVHYSVGANIGFCHTYLSDIPMMPGSFITLIRADESKINPIYLGVVLNSIIGRIQSEKRKSGTAQPYIYPKDLREFIIPVLPINIQESIASKLQESYLLRQESKRLMELAKNAVELAICEAEGNAIMYIEKSSKLHIGTSFEA